MGDKQKRSRVTVKKEGTDKVFTANKNGELTKGKTGETPATQASAQTVETAKETAASSTPASETEAPKRKPGRPRKVKQEAAPAAETEKRIAEVIYTGSGGLLRRRKKQGRKEAASS